MKKSLILGLGNPIVSDDGIGIYAVRKILEKIGSNDFIHVKEASVGGFDLIEILSGYDSVIIIDAIKTGKYPPGHILELTSDDFVTTCRLAFIHEIDLPMALEFGKKLGIPMPEDIIILAVEGENLNTFSEELSCKVKEALPVIVDRVMELISVAKNNYKIIIMKSDRIVN
jgi:hydrogenase maturation protease